MPELPEVETTKRGIQPHLEGQMISKLVVRQYQLRWPIPTELESKLPGTRIESVSRRGKYLLIGTERGSLILHLGMSGSLRIVPSDMPPRKHDHVDIVLEKDICLRFHDPRRFGAVLWTEQDPFTHSLLKNLGPEPFDASFNGNALYDQSRGRKLPVKSFIMDSRIVVGVGNIYANEALFDSGILPQRATGRISKNRYQLLTESIRGILSDAIAQGGTTLKDFVNETGNPGYFQQTLKVYGRKGETCALCDASIRQFRIAQRATYYCPGCQR